MHLESVRVGVKVPSTTDSNVYYKLLAFEDDSCNETEYQKHRDTGSPDLLDVRWKPTGVLMNRNDPPMPVQGTNTL